MVKRVEREVGEKEKVRSKIKEEESATKSPTTN